MESEVKATLSRVFCWLMQFFSWLSQSFLFLRTARHLCLYISLAEPLLFLDLSNNYLASLSRRVTVSESSRTLFYSFKYIDSLLELAELRGLVWVAEELQALISQVLLLVVLVQAHPFLLQTICSFSLLKSIIKKSYIIIYYHFPMYYQNLTLNYFLIFQSQKCQQNIFPSLQIFKIGLKKDRQFLIHLFIDIFKSIIISSQTNKKPAKMQNQGERWKAINQAKRNKTQSSVQSRSRSKKYLPQRGLDETNLSKNIRVINQSKGENSSLQNTRHFALARSKTQNTEDAIEKSRFAQRLHLNLQKIPVMQKKEFSEIQSPLSPDIDLKLTRLQRQLAKQRRENQVHFSLDEEHRYLHQEIQKIREEFINFKRFILLEIDRQEKMIREISRQMSEQVDDATLKWQGSNHKQKNRGIILNPSSISPILIDDLSSINQDTGSLTESKIELNKFTMTLEKSIQNITAKINRKGFEKSHNRVNHQTNMTKSQVMNKLSKSAQKISQFQLKGTTSHQNYNDLEIEGFKQKFAGDSSRKRPTYQSRVALELKQKAMTSREKSKKQFSKLFEAVKCLKNDVTGLTDTTEKKDTPTEKSQNQVAKSPRDNHYLKIQRRDEEGQVKNGIEGKNQTVPNPLNKRIFGKYTSNHVAESNLNSAVRSKNNLRLNVLKNS